MSASATFQLHRPKRTTTSNFGSFVLVTITNDRDAEVIFFVQHDQYREVAAELRAAANELDKADLSR